MERELQKDPALSRAGPQNLPPLTQQKIQVRKVELRVLISLHKLAIDQGGCTATPFKASSQSLASPSTVMDSKFSCFAIWIAHKI